jgi:hypothetical protein
MHSFILSETAISVFNSGFLSQSTYYCVQAYCKHFKPTLVISFGEKLPRFLLLRPFHLSCLVCVTLILLIANLEASCTPGSELLCITNTVKSNVHDFRLPLQSN